MFEVMQGKKILMNSDEVYEDLDTLRHMKKESGYKFRLDGKLVSDIKILFTEGGKE